MGIKQPSCLHRGHSSSKEVHSSRTEDAQPPLEHTGRERLGQGAGSLGAEKTQCQGSHTESARSPSLVQFHVLQRQKRMAWLRRWVTNLTRGLALVSVPIAWIMPADVTLYWLCSSSFALGQNMLMAAPRFRRACSIPITASESQTPFKDVADRLRQRLAFKMGS